MLCDRRGWITCQQCGLRRRPQNIADFAGRPCTVPAQPSSASGQVDRAVAADPFAADAPIFSEDEGEEAIAFDAPPSPIPEEVPTSLASRKQEVKAAVKSQSLQRAIEAGARRTAAAAVATSISPQELSDPVALLAEPPTWSTIHDSHDVRRGSFQAAGYIFCIKCGKYGQATVRELKEPCPLRPLPQGGARERLMRLCSGQDPKESRPRGHIGRSSL